MKFSVSNPDFILKTSGNATSFLLLAENEDIDVFVGLQLTFLNDNTIGFESALPEVPGRRFQHYAGAKVSNAKLQVVLSQISSCFDRCPRVCPSRSLHILFGASNSPVTVLVYNQMCHNLCENTSIPQQTFGDCIQKIPQSRETRGYQCYYHLY